nr:hypothetical protein [uncultured Moellerella sp.]
MKKFIIQGLIALIALVIIIRFFIPTLSPCGNKENDIFRPVCENIFGIDSKE